MFTIPVYFVTTDQDTDQYGNVTLNKWSVRFDNEDDARAHATGLTTDGADDVRIWTVNVPVRVSTAVLVTD